MLCPKPLVIILIYAPFFPINVMPAMAPMPTNAKQSLRFDIADSAYAPLKETKGAFAIVPGKPEESELYKRISSTDPTYQMPVPESHLGLLNEHEIALFKKWIEQGAKYEQHWAFITTKKNAITKSKR